MPDKPPRVFISYAQEGEAHSDWVRALADALTREGIEAAIDQRVEWPEKGWRPWMSEQIAAADWVLVVCTSAYRRRFDDNAEDTLPQRRGVRWESQHITQALYDGKFRNRRFVPVLPPTADDDDVPFALRDYRRFRLGETFEIHDDDRDHEGFTALYRLLTGQPAYPAPKPGNLRRLAPLTAGAESQSVAELETTPLPAANIPNPYPGLVAFTPDRQRFYFGRDEDIPRVVSRLAEGRFVCVIGNSGTGKSRSAIGSGASPLRQHRWISSSTPNRPVRRPVLTSSPSLRAWWRGSRFAALPRWWRCGPMRKSPPSSMR